MGCRPERAGIRAVTINSTNLEQWEDTHQAIAAGVDVLGDIVSNPLLDPEELAGAVGRVAAGEAVFQLTTAGLGYRYIHVEVHGAYLGASRGS